MRSLEIRAFKFAQRHKGSAALKLARRLYAGVLPYVHPRRFQAFGVGIFKTGTTTLATIFGQHYRAAHEPGRAELSNYLREQIEFSSTGLPPSPALSRWLQQRDRRLWLELESSGFMNPFVPILVEAFPDARFILTIRDCSSWLDSMVEQNFRTSLTEDLSNPWLSIASAFSMQRRPYAPEEKILETLKLATLEGYLRSYTARCENVLKSVPAERLLIVRTHELKQSIPKLATFLGIPESTVTLSNANQNTASTSYSNLRKQHASLPESPTKIDETTGKAGILKQIDPAFVRDQIREHCGALMDRFFPDFDH